jgi:hypothetical protein
MNFLGGVLAKHPVILIQCSNSPVCQPKLLCKVAAPVVMCDVIQPLARNRFIYIAASLRFNKHVVHLKQLLIPSKSLYQLV